nr:zinc finger, CCHC-type [Tanacetum cinerariifolium]
MVFVSSTAVHQRAGQQSCHICKASRYKSDELGGSLKSRKSNKPVKVLRYFPLIPRLKRLYKCKKTAKDMRWHDTGRTKDGKLRHLADGLAWSALNDRYSQFASDPRSVRLGLASDGFNPFAGGNLLSKTTREALKIIENKSKVHYSRSKLNVSRVNTNSRDSSSKTNDRIDKLADQNSNLVEIVNKQVITPATAKAVDKTYVICGGAHAYYDCIATDSNQSSVCATMGTYNQVSPPNRASNQIPPPSFAPVQNNQN